MKTFIIIFLTIVGGFSVISSLIALTILGGMLWKWWSNLEVPEPTYDPSVRQKEDKSLPIIVGALALFWFVLNFIVVF